MRKPDNGDKARESGREAGARLATTLASNHARSTNGSDADVGGQEKNQEQEDVDSELKAKI